MEHRSIIFFTVLLCLLFSISINNVYSLAPPSVPTLPFSVGSLDLSVPRSTGSVVDRNLDTQNNDDTVILPDSDEAAKFRDLDSALNRDLLALGAATQSEEAREINEALLDDDQKRALAKSDLVTENLQDRIDLAATQDDIADIQKTLSPPTSNCDTNKYDLAVHDIDGTADFSKVLHSLNEKTSKDVIFQIIVDNDPTESTLVLLDTVATNLKGKIIIGAHESDPKEVDYDIEKINTDCILTTVAEKTLKIESKINNPLVITDSGSKLLKGPTGVGSRNPLGATTDQTGGGQIFQECKTSDFAKYSIVADGKNLAKSGDANGNNVNLKIKIVVDLDRSPITAKNAATVIDDNRILALNLITDQGKSDEEIFKFIPVSINTDCNTVSFLEKPVNIADKHEFPNPLYGFKEG